jgi:uncharacterized membrane protein
MQEQVVFATFDNEDEAKEALDQLKQARKAAALDFDDTAVIMVDPDGTFHIKDSEDVGMGKGAGRGAIVGGLIGLLAGPAGVVIGAGTGALIGGLFNEGDDGFKDEGLEALAEKLKPGSSAIVAVVPGVWISEFETLLSKHSDDVSVRVLDEKVAAQLNVEVSDAKDNDA